jgi:hypothetical protein
MAQPMILWVNSLIACVDFVDMTRLNIFTQNKQNHPIQTNKI